jgi:hypothetical protein
MNNNSCNIVVTKLQISVHLEYYSIIQTTTITTKMFISYCLGSIPSYQTI